MAAVELNAALVRIKEKLSLLSTSLTLGLEVGDEERAIEAKRQRAAGIVDVRVPLPLWTSLRLQRDDLLGCIEEFNATLETLQQQYVNEKQQRDAQAQIQEERIRLLEQICTEQQEALQAERAVSQQWETYCHADRAKIQSFSSVLQQVVEYLDMSQK